ncbi:hypothetical protein [Swaminathania salitolerans]|uniref:Uncharacterized protein n=1 Tax=Swaminathania salitolerans TaxID=182838 RepID=A0A511BSH2_9PROT|nr:hypothetical protein [Swaminathania salitolerans]GBQ09697.1 hypothetical protein AA21291_0165 [Swaminathania salitolerans LMG 21291]GEL00878.1 hypothetical protein SSA02_00410 [Swaminathania salitolerans]
MAIVRDRDDARLHATDRKILFDTYPAPGTARDFARRLRLILPEGWFPVYRGDEEEDAPRLQALLTGFGAVLSQIWSLMGVVRDQTRIGSVRGVFLDMAATDLFGSSGMCRLPQEKDTHFRRRMIEAISAEKTTRRAVSEAVRQIAGAPPRLIEPGSVRDCGALNVLGGYGATRLRYGSLAGGQFCLELMPKLPLTTRALCTAVKDVKALGVTAWIRMDM